MKVENLFFFYLINKLKYIVISSLEIQHFNKVKIQYIYFLSFPNINLSIRNFQI